MQLLDVKAKNQSTDQWELPVSVTTTAVNLTGSWKFFRPQLVEK